MDASNYGQFSNLKKITLLGNYSIGWDEGPILAIDPGGANRALTFPTGGEHRVGTEMKIINTADAAEDLTVAAAQLITDQAITCSRGEMMIATYMGYEKSESVPGNEVSHTENGWAVGVLGTT